MSDGEISGCPARMLTYVRLSAIVKAAYCLKGELTVEDIQLTWIILAGGDSTRMGRPKHLLPWKAGTLLDEAVRKACRMDAAEVLVSARTACPPYRCCRDIISKSGPLGGIHACLQQAKEEMCMILPVDVPLFPEELVPEMARYASANNCEYLPLVWNGKLEPTVAIVRRSALGAIKEMLQNRQLRMSLLLQHVRSDVFSREGDPLLLYNCNTPEQYAYLCQHDHCG